MNSNFHFKSNIFFGLLIVVTSCSNLREEPLHMFRGDLYHSGVYVGEPLSEKPEILWKTNLDSPVFGSPVIAGNKIFQGDGSGNLYAIDKTSGETIWIFRAGGAIYSTPLVYRENLYFTCYDSYFYSVNVINGELSWKFKTEGEKHFRAPGIHGLQPKDSVMEDDWDFYLSSPAADDEKVFFGTGSGWIYALDATDGSERWKFKAEDVVHCSPAVSNDMVFIGDWKSNMFALDEETGKMIWSFQGGIDTVMYNQVGIQSSPVISDSTLYFGCRDAHVYALDLYTGDLKWKVFNNNSWVINTPVIYKDQLLYGTSDTQKFRVLNKFSGELIYELQLKGFIFSSPVLVEDYAYFGTGNGIIYGINLDAQGIAWNFEGISARQDSLEILYDDMNMNFQKIFSEGTKSGMERALDMIMTIGPFYSTAVYDEGTLYIPSSDGVLYALQ